MYMKSAILSVARHCENNTENKMFIAIIAFSYICFYKFMTIYCNYLRHFI